MSSATFEIRLFGAFELRAVNGDAYEIRGAKYRALIALLALAPNGKHSRSLLQDMLWGRSGPELGRSSLRRALSDLRKLMGDSFDELFTATNAEVALHQDRLAFLGGASDGEFLEGIRIEEPRFAKWLDERRMQAADRRLRQPSVIEARLSPVVCVVPFTPLLSNAQNGQIGDLVAMEVTRALSKCAFVDVISHLSSRRFQFSSLNVATVRSEMNADYMMTGSFVVSGQHLRLSADLMDLQSERLVWNHEYDLSLDDLASTDWREPREIAQAILDTIINESVRALQSPSAQGLSVHQRLMAAISLMHQQRREVVSRAHAELSALIDENPAHAILHAWLAKLYVLSVHQGWVSHSPDDTASALWHSREALRLDPTCSVSRAIHGQVLTNLCQDFDTGAIQFDEALAQDSSNALAWLLKGAMLAFSDRGSEAVLCTSKARNLSPLDPHRYYYDCLSATAHLTISDYATAKRLANRSYVANPRHMSTLRVQIIANQELGDTDAARRSARQLLTLDPDFTVDGYLKSHPAAAFGTGETWARALSAAGVPLN